MNTLVKERPSPEPAGLILGWFGLLVMLGGLLLAAWYGQFLIVIVLALVLAAAGLSYLWSRYSLAGVSCERSISERRIFPGESIELRLRLTNRKLLPLPCITADDEIPQGLHADTPLEPGYQPGLGLLSKTAALLWYTSISWKHRLEGKRRGYHTLGPLTLTSGDIFGFYPRSLTTTHTDHIIVYPRIFTMAQLGVRPLYPIGETTAEKRIFEDPVRVIGVRDYSPHDSLRYIHWKASARHQNLQVKVFEPTTTLTAAIFLGVDSFRHRDPPDEELFELGISTAASVANHLIERHSSVGLFVNSRLADTGQPAEILPGSSTEQLVAMLEALAKVTGEVSEPFEDFIQSGLTSLPWGTTIVLVLSGHRPRLNDMITVLKESGHRLSILQIGEPAEIAASPGTGWHNIRQPDDFVKIGGEGIK